MPIGARFFVITLRSGTNTKARTLRTDISAPPNPKGPLEIRSEKRSLFDHPKISLLPFLNLSLNLLDAFARLVPSGHLIVGNPSFPEVPVPRHGGVPSFA